MTSNKPNYYQILGVDKTATSDEIKKVYRKLALQWHPDRWVSKSESEKNRSEEMMKQINNAHDVLSDPKKRKAYDLLINSPNINAFTSESAFLILIGMIALAVLFTEKEENKN